MSEALRLIGSVEARSRLLRRLPARRLVRRGDNGALVEGWGRWPGMPFELAAPAGDTQPDDLPPVRADAVLVGRPNHRLRARAFYDAAGVSLVVHGRMSLTMRNRLGAGAAVVEKVSGRVSLVMPQPRERGRGWRHAWLVEDLLRGRPVGVEEWPSIGQRVADSLFEIWAVPGLRVRDSSGLVGDAEMSAALDVLDSTAAGEENAPLRSRAREVAGASIPMAVGLCHGDPVPSNVLQLADGRLGLLDWEGAGRRAVAHDAVKALGWLEDPVPLAERLGERIKHATATSAAEWRSQLIIEALRVLGRTRGQHARAEARSGDFMWYVERRRRHMLKLLRALVPSG